MKLNARRTLTTTASPEQVFTFLGDFRTTETWDPGTVTTTLLGGEPGEGATYRNVSEFMGRKTEVTYTTLEYRPSSKLHHQGRNDSFVGDDRFTLSPDGAGTRVEYHATFELRGASALATPFVAAYLPFLARKTVKQLQASLDAL